VAGNYTRTIEFTAKDAQIKRAVEKLAKSLTTIDKIVDKINGKFVKNLKGSIGDISKELKNTVKVATDLGKVFTDNAKKAKRVTVEMEKQAMIAKVQTKSESRRLDRIEKTDKAVRPRRGSTFSTDPRGKTQLAGVSSTENAALIEAEQKLTSFMAKIGQAQAYYSQNEQGLLRQISAFKNLASSIDVSKNAIQKHTVEYQLFSDATKGQAIAEQNLLKIEKERINIRKGLVLGKGVQPAADALGTYDTAETLLAKSDEAIGNTLAEVNLYKSQLEDAVQFIEIGTDLWKQTNSKIEQINTSLGKNTETAKRIRKEEKERTKELDAQRKILNDIAKRNTQRIKKGVMELFGVVGGKRGLLPQLASINLLSNGIQKLIKFVPFLGQKLKAQVRNWAEVGKVATKVLGGITIASGVLTKTLGVTTWVADAIKGFIQFEDVASKVIWSIEGQMSKAFSLFGRLARELPNIASAAMMVMPEALGGAGLPMGDAAGFFSKGSAYNELAAKVQSLMSGRNESRRYGRQGPTDLQKDQRRLEWYNKLLSQRNRTADDYVTILNKAAQVERNISRETKIQADLRARSNGELAKQRRIRQAEIRRARQQKRRERSTGYFNAFDDRAEAFEFQRAEQQAQIYMRKDVQSMMTGIDPNEDRRVTKGAWERLQRRRSNRQQMNARTREGLMLGAGFPILFGGGLGSVAGGVGGALAQSKMGPGSGFGAQILLSALGQSIDAFVVKTAEMGKALGDFTKDTGALTEALGLAGTAEGQRIKNIQAAEGEQAAFDATVKQLTATVGEVGVQRLKDFGEQWTDLMMSMQGGLLRVQSAFAGVLLAIDKIFKFSERSREDRIRIFAATSDDKTLVDLRKRKAAIEKGTGLGGRAGSNQRTKALKDIDKQILEKATPAFNKMIKDTKEDKLYIGSKLESTDKEIALLEKMFRMKSANREVLEKELEIEKEVKGVQRDQVDELKAKLKYKKELEDANELLKKQEEELKAVYDAIGVSIKNGLVEGINAAIDGTKTLGEVASNTFRRISDSLLDYGIKAGLSALPGGVGTFFQGALGMAKTPVAPVAPLGMTQGADMSSMPKGMRQIGVGATANDLDRHRAAGGPVSGGTPYIVGEKGPELFTPRSSGNIIPNHQLGGSTSVVVNVDASGSSVEGDAEEARNLGKAISAAIQQELVTQRRPGGLLSV
jgi:hypothetical protein